MGSPHERRGSGRIRLPIRAPVSVEPLDCPGGPARGENENLGPGGLSLQLDQALPSGTRVSVTLHLRHSPPVVFAGTVVWIQPRPDSGTWVLGIRLDQRIPEERVAEIADAEYPPWSSPGDRGRGVWNPPPSSPQ